MSTIDNLAERVREFNRFYTREIGVLNEGLLKSPFSLTELRVLYELAHMSSPTAVGIRKELNLDPGYLSRIVKRFVKQGLLQRTRSSEDTREYSLALTARGRKEFALLDQRSHEEIGALLRCLPSRQRERLVGALGTAQRILERRVPASREAHHTLRPHQPGDMGWVVERHGVLYFQEYGWDERFEAIVARIVADFIQKLDPRRERCWIAERNGERAGSIFLVRKNASTSQLRLLLVEPHARGCGLGRQLVDECLSFARQAGYRKVILWTNSVLDAARHIYQRAGFELVEESPHNDFGAELIGQTWELKL